MASATATKPAALSKSEQRILRELKGNIATRQHLGATKYIMDKLIDLGLVKRKGELKTPGLSARRGVGYALTDKGRKRAARV